MNNDNPETTAETDPVELKKLFDDTHERLSVAMEKLVADSMALVGHIDAARDFIIEQQEQLDNMTTSRNAWRFMVFVLSGGYAAIFVNTYIFGG